MVTFFGWKKKQVWICLQVPQIILDDFHKRQDRCSILVSQSRGQTVISSAERVSYERGATSCTASSSSSNSQSNVSCKCIQSTLLNRCCWDDTKLFSRNLLSSWKYLICWSFRYMTKGLKVLQSFSVLKYCVRKWQFFWEKFLKVMIAWFDRPDGLKLCRYVRIHLFKTFNSEAPYELGIWLELGIFKNYFYVFFLLS